jgi:hypothetical protein
MERTPDVRICRSAGAASAVVGVELISVLERVAALGFAVLD